YACYFGFAVEFAILFQNDDNNVLDKTKSIVENVFLCYFLFLFDFWPFSPFDELKTHFSTQYLSLMQCRGSTERRVIFITSSEVLE
ncbi:MAG: hypothetical protein ACFFB3_16895, partial [Candidatus Hodarchaeota archaeon]